MTHTEVNDLRVSGGIAINVSDTLTPRPGCRIDRMLLDQAEVLVESSVDEDGNPLLCGVLINGRLINPESCIAPDVMEEWRDELRRQMPRVYVDTVRELEAKEHYYAGRYGDDL